MITLNKEKKYISIESDDHEASAFIHLEGVIITITVDNGNGTEAVSHCMPIEVFLHTLGIKQGKEG